jgi:hypothetical protein
MRSFSLKGIATKAFWGPNAQGLGYPTGGGAGNSSYFPSAGVGWTNRGQPSGNPIYALASDTAGNTLFVDVAGLVYLSINGGATWAHQGTIAGFAPLQTSGALIVIDTVWIVAAPPGTGPGTIYRSTDTGATWTNIDTGITNGGNLALGTQAPATVLAVANETPAPPADYGLSIDGGLSWVSAGVTTVGGTNGNFPLLWTGAEWVLFSNDPVTDNPAVWVSANALTWTETLFSDTTVTVGPALLNGGIFYLGDANIPAVYSGATVGDVAAAPAVTIPTTSGVNYLIHGTGQFYALDNDGTVANSPDFVHWRLGVQNFAPTEVASAACMLASGGVVAGGSLGTICTVP